MRIFEFSNDIQKLVRARVGAPLLQELSCSSSASPPGKQRNTMLFVGDEAAEILVNSLTGEFKIWEFRSMLDQSQP